MGGAANPSVGPPHPALSPRPAGGEERKAGPREPISRRKCSANFPRTALRESGNPGRRFAALPPVQARGRLWTPAFAGVTRRVY